MGEWATISPIRGINTPFTSIRWKILFAFLLIVGGELLCGSHLAHWAGGRLFFDDRKQQDRVSTSRLARSWPRCICRPRRRRCRTAGSRRNRAGRAPDGAGHERKVQADSQSELNGSRMELPEVAAFSRGKNRGLRRPSDGKQEPALDVLGLFRPFDQGVEWVAYSTAGLVQNRQTIRGAAADLAHAGHDGAAVHPAGQNDPLFFSLPPGWPW